MMIALKVKHFINLLSPKVRNIAALITVSSFTFSSLWYAWNYHQDLKLENEKLKTQLANGQMVLWVKNMTTKPKSFHYMNVLEGRGSGTTISPGKIDAIKMKKGVYNWYYSNSSLGSKDTDTIETGQIVFKYLQQKELIIIDQ